jgi:TPR repeat protein
MRKIILVVMFLLLIPTISFAITDLDLGDKAYEDKNYTEAIKQFKKAATKGSAYAQYKLGVIYSETALNNKVIKAESVKWHKLAAAQGYAKSQSSLAALYFWGLGVQVNTEEALKYAK